MMNMTFKRAATSVAVTALAVLLLPTSRLAAQEASGPEVWANNCGLCHRLRAVDSFTASQWNTIVTHMALVARLTASETRAVREFLVGSAEAREMAANGREPATAVARVPVVGTTGGAQGAGMTLVQNPGRDPVTGVAIYRANCVACHGAHGRGDGPAAVALNPRPTDLTDTAHRVAVTDSAVAEVIMSGRRGMPAFGRTLSSSQIDSLVGYVRSLQR